MKKLLCVGALCLAFANAAAQNAYTLPQPIPQEKDYYYDNGTGVFRSVAQGLANAATVVPWANTVVDTSLPPYNVVGNGNLQGTVGTDNTAALQAAINAVEYTGTGQGKGPRLLLPTGYMMTGCLTITGQVFIEGASDYASVLNIKSGTNCALFTVALAGYNFPAAGYPPAVDWFTHFRITSVDGANAGPLGTNTAPLADGIYLPNGCTISGIMTVDDVTFYNVPADGIHANCTLGDGEIMNSLFQTCGDTCIATNSTSDWKYLNLDVEGGYRNNIGSGGDASLFFFNVNSYTSRGNGGYFYGTEHVYMTGHNEFNQNTAAGLRFDSLGSTSVVQIDDMNMGVNNDDVYLDPSGSGVVLMREANFPAPTGSPQNIDFRSGTADILQCLACTFQDGGSNASGTTNNQAQLATLDFGPFENAYNTVSINGTPVAGGPIAVIGACGTSPTVSGNNFSGTITTGTGTFTSCKIGWGLSRANVPVCNVTNRGGGTAVSYVPSAGITPTGGLVITTAATGAVFDYVCTGG